MGRIRQHRCGGAAAPAGLLFVGAVSLWLRRGGGLYWVTASVATGFIIATANAWALLAEIKR
jgi:hypothetical protein